MTQYLFPDSPEEAARLLKAHSGEAQVIAGGTDLLPDLRDGKIRPRYLIDVTRIPGLDQIEVTDTFVQIGAAVTFAQIKEAPFLQRHVHALTDAARSVGAIGIQNAATWVGNVVQAMPAADGAIMAIALQAEARLVEGNSATWRPVESLFVGPGRSIIDPTRQLITHVRFPRPQPRWASAWQRLGRRPALVLPILNCAVTLQLNIPGTEVAWATIALGPVAPRPLRARKAEAFLKGRPPTREVFTQAARFAQGACNPRSSVMRASREYRLTIIPTLVQEALTIAARRARSEEPDR